MGFFTLPDIHDEATFRPWVTTVVGMIRTVITAITPTELDDRAFDFFLATVANDATWAPLYQFMLILAGPNMMVAPSPPEELKAAAAEAGVDWGRVFEIIMAILALILKGK